MAITQDPHREGLNREAQRQELREGGDGNQGLGRAYTRCPGLILPPVAML